MLLQYQLEIFYPLGLNEKEKYFYCHIYYNESQTFNFVLKIFCIKVQHSVASILLYCLFKFICLFTYVYIYGGITFVISCGISRLLDVDIPVWTPKLCV